MTLASSKRLSQITAINYIWICLLQIDILLYYLRILSSVMAKVHLGPSRPTQAITAGHHSEIFMVSESNGQLLFLDCQF